MPKNVPQTWENLSNEFSTRGMRARAIGAHELANALEAAAVFSEHLKNCTGEMEKLLAEINRLASRTK